MKKGLLLIIITLSFYSFFTEKNEEVFIEADFSFENACIYESVLFTDLSQGSATSWDWDFDNGTGMSNEQDPEFTFSGDGIFNVRLIVSDGVESDTITKQIVIQNEIPTYQDTIVCNNQPVIFNGKTYQEFVPSLEIFTYTDTLVSSLGCDSIAVFRVTVNPCLCESEYPMVFPNVFTPDGDGVNDTFGPIVFCGEGVRDYWLIIYDRWGETVFETYEYQKLWDGTINGFPMPSDVLIYFVRYELRQGNVSQQVSQVGDFTLIR